MARKYENEKYVGQVIYKSRIPKKKLFVTTKL